MSPAAAPGYARNFRDLNRLISRGKSFSGFERNALFLNVKDNNSDARRFADVAGLAAADFDDDARAAARVDWDRDGDLDLWITNRTAPRTRLLLNQMSPSGSSVAIRVVGNGTTTNRDAIGARLVLWPSEHPEGRQFRSHRAGDGFLAQSSQWVHFGLGTTSGPLTLAVTWPGGGTETFADLQPGGRYLAIQGTGAVRAERAPAVSLPPAHAASAVQDRPSRGIWLAQRLPFPEIEYTAKDGTPRNTTQVSGEARLVNLWATWCAPCRVELKDLADHADRLRALKADVLALNVDGLGEGGGQSPATIVPADFLMEIGFASEQGTATASGLGKLEVLVEFLTSRRAAIPTPTSFLVDRQGELAAVYFGPVNIERCLADVGLLDASPEAQLPRLSPRPGRWLIDPRKVDRRSYLGDYAAHFAANGLPADAEAIYARLASEDGPARAQDLFNQAKLSAANGKIADAIDLYREAIKLDPQYGEALTGLGALLLVQKRPDEARTVLEKALAIDPHHATALINLALIDRQDGRPDAAISRLRSVLDRNPDYAEAHLNLGSVLASLRRFEEGIPHLEQGLEKNPSMTSGWLALAAACAEAGQWVKAENAYRRALALNPRVTPAYAGLGSVLSGQKRHAEAIEVLQRAVAEGAGSPGILTQLGLCHHAVGEMQAAEASFHQALKLQPGYEPARRALESLPESPRPR